MIKIRKATELNQDDILFTFRNIVRTGDTYNFFPNIEKQDALNYWTGTGTNCFIAIDDEKIIK